MAITVGNHRKWEMWGGNPLWTSLQPGRAGLTVMARGELRRDHRRDLDPLAIATEQHRRDVSPWAFSASRA